jgi:hypothetical protein
MGFSIMNDRLRQVLVILATVGQAVLGWWSNTAIQPSNGEVSDSFMTYFIPDGLTFAVWGYLYLIVIAYGVYQLLPSQTTRPLHRSIGPWVALGCGASAIWPLIFQSSGVFGTPEFNPLFLWLSVGVILVLLFSLIKVVAAIIHRNRQIAGTDRWLVALPFYSYLAWGSVATIANVTVLLISLGWTAEMGGPIWSTVMIVVATLIVLGVMFVSWNRAGIIGFGAVIVWALLGIYRGNADASMLVGTVALAAGAVVALVALWRAFQVPPAAKGSPVGA